MLTCSVVHWLLVYSPPLFSYLSTIWGGEMQREKKETKVVERESWWGGLKFDWYSNMPFWTNSNLKKEKLWKVTKPSVTTHLSFIFNEKELWEHVFKKWPPLTFKITLQIQIQIEIEHMLKTADGISSLDLFLTSCSQAIPRGPKCKASQVAQCKESPYQCRRGRRHETGVWSLDQDDPLD